MLSIFCQSKMNSHVTVPILLLKMNLNFLPVTNYYTTYGFRKCSFSYNQSFFSTGISSEEQFLIDFERRVQNNPTIKSNTSFCNGTPQYR
jgi:hypothetical protein